MVSSNIRAKRQDAGMTVRDLAKRMGTSSANVSRWERESSRINLVTLDKVAKVLGVKPSDLVSDDAGPPGGVELRSSAPKVLIVTVPSLQPGVPAIPFEESYLRTLTNKGADELSSMLVSDETMMPTLRHGDALLIEDCTEVDRPGLYAGTQGKHTHIRRILDGLKPGTLTIVTDHDDYPDFHDVPAHNFPVIGRVIWVGRAMA